jgi:hypothetical protein
VEPQKNDISSAIVFAKIAKRVSSGNRARGEVVAQFLEQLTKHTDLLILPSLRPLEVVVVGGSAEEPEIEALRQLGLYVNVYTIGIEDSDVNLDLNLPPRTGLLDQNIDLLLCSQVCEHIWNHENFFRNIAELCQNSKYLWLGVPASNRPHASPDFFSAGFTQDYLQRNLEYRGLQVLKAGQIGSRRLYESAMLSDSWMTYISHRFPPFQYLSEVRSEDSKLALFRATFQTMKSCPQLLRFLFLSSKIDNSQRYATESWALARGFRD